MEHKGKAAKAYRRIAVAGFAAAAVAVALFTLFAKLRPDFPAVAATRTVIGLYLLFLGFGAYFFRDPDASVPPGTGLIVAPAHGLVDVIDETEEPQVMGGRCRRVSIFLSVFDVHVQQAPVAGRVIHLRHTPGKFLNALKVESAAHNENVVIGFESIEPTCGRVAIKLIAGLIARRIVTWTTVGDAVPKGGRVGLIRFGSRVDLYLPPEAEVAVKLGDRVVGGETVVARMRP